jgi:hypothetical protein
VSSKEEYKMESEEQQKHNEDLERMCEANGDEYSALKNSKGDVENIAIERTKYDSKEEERILSELVGDPYIRENRSAQQDLMKIHKRFNESIRKLDNSPWYKRAFNRAKALFTGKSYTQVVMEDLDQKLDKMLSTKKEKYTQFKSDYSKEQADLKELTNVYEGLSDSHDSVVTEMETDTKFTLKLKKNELIKDMEYNKERRSICEKRIRTYEPLLEILNTQILAIKKARLKIEESLNFEKSFYFRKIGLQNT